MAKSQAWSLPGALGNAAVVLNAPEQKDKSGDRLIKRLSIPRTPTKKDRRYRLTVSDEPQDFLKFYDYCDQDVVAEGSVGILTPDLTPYELEVWRLDQKINFKGISIDRPGLDNCIDIIKQAQFKYIAELQTITGGAVNTVGEIQKTRDWLALQGVGTTGLDKEYVESLLERGGLPAAAQRVLEIRLSIGAASVKKLHAMDRRASSDDRLRGLFRYCGADRTGRWAGKGIQPHNLPNSGPLDKWDIEAVEAALRVISTRSLTKVENAYKDATAVVSGCLRGLLCAPDGHDWICSDYSAIEAVVLAFLAGEQWRMDVFNTHGLIYEASAAKITGVPFEDFVRHKKETGDHHPLRKKIGKFAELASGYQGSLGAWKQFGAGEYLTDDEIKKNVQAWRDASPAIVAFWEGLQNAAFAAIKTPGAWYEYRGIWYIVREDVLYCRLLSGRFLSYHKPRVKPEVKPWGKTVMSITYMGWNTDYKKGPKGWMRLSTYGGKLTENVVQATARDVLAHGMLNLDRARYPLVLHVHDEAAAEVPHGSGGFTLEDFEHRLSTMPAWCSHWPIKAKGGWVGKRYRKD